MLYFMRQIKDSFFFLLDVSNLINKKQFGTMHSIIDGDWYDKVMREVPNLHATSPELAHIPL